MQVIFSNISPLNDSNSYLGDAQTLEMIDPNMATLDLECGGGLAIIREE